MLSLHWPVCDFLIDCPRCFAFMKYCNVVRPIVPIAGLSNNFLETVKVR